MAFWFDKVKQKYVISYYPAGWRGKEIRRVIPEQYQSEEGAAAYHELHSKFMEKKPEKVALPETIGQLAPGYFDWLHLHRPGSERDIRGCFKNHVLPHLKDIAVKKIAPAHFTFYKQARKQEKGSNVSINKEVSYLRGFFKYLARDLGAIDPLPFKTERLKYERPIPTILEADAAEALLAAMEPFYQAYFLLLYGAGLRRNEARMLLIEDVDLKAGSIKIIRKGGKKRILPIGGWPLEALRDVIGERSEGYVFASRRHHGKPIYDARKALGRAKKKVEDSGIPLRGKIGHHTFRHSIATRMVREGVDIRVIQEFLGHSQVTTTQWYAQVQPEVLRRSIIKIDKPVKKGEIMKLIRKKPLTVSGS